MALQVWLPLNGDLNNQGLKEYNISAARGSIVYHDQGKIGKCFNANGINTLSIENSSADLYNYTAYSVCAWFYITAQNTSHSGSAIVSVGNWNSQVINLAVSNWSTDHYTQLRISGNNWNNSYSYNFAINTWYHGVVCCDGIHTYAYINGELIGDTASPFLPTNFSDSNHEHIFIGGATYYSGMQFYGRINDVRIYDHCLSKKEIKEIYHALILHYKLDDTAIEATTNLCTSGTLSNTCYNGAISKYGYGTNSDMYKTQGEFQGRYCTKVYMGTSGAQAYPYVYFDNLFVALNSTTYPEYKTLSFDYYQTIGTSINFYKLGSGSATATYRVDYDNSLTGSGTNSRTIPISSNQWHHIEITFHATTTDSAQWGYMQTSNHISNVDNYWLFANIQIEAKDHATAYTKTSRDETLVYDCSGYGHHGTIVGVVSIDSSTPRYLVSSNMNNTGTANHIESNAALGLLESNITASFWVKCDKSKSQVIFADPQFEFGILSNLGYVSLSSKPGFDLTNFITNEWNHIAVVKTGTSAYTLYINGQVATQNGSSNYYLHNGNLLYLLNRNYNNNYAAAASISDFRIYATALSAADVLELYNTAAIIDKGQNFYGRQLIESIDHKINKTGVINANCFYEGLNEFDKDLRIESDGSLWLRVMYHNNPASAIFSATNNWADGFRLDSNRWYMLENVLPLLTTYEFMVIQQTTSDATPTKYRWIQNINPMDATWNDVKPGTCTYITTTGYNTPTYTSGMYYRNGNGQRMCIANSNSSNWYGGIGVWNAYGGGIPGFPNTTITSGFIELFVRADNNLPYTAEHEVRQYKSGQTTSNSLYEF